MQLTSYVINSQNLCYGNGQCNGGIGSNTDNRNGNIAATGGIAIMYYRMTQPMVLLVQQQTPCAAGTLANGIGLNDNRAIRYGRGTAPQCLCSCYELCDKLPRKACAATDADNVTVTSVVVTDRKWSICNRRNRDH
jgi:hypothetical protein